MGTSDRETVEQGVRNASAVQLGQRLRQARVSRNLTQGEVAAGQFSVSYISAVERGQIRPSLGALERLAARLEIPIADLLRMESFEVPAPGASLAEFFPTKAREEAESALIEAQVRLQQGDAPGALQVLQALQSRGGLVAAEEALVAWRRAEGYRALKRAEEARAQAQEALARAERLGDPEMRERVRLELGRALALAHTGAAAIGHFQQGRAAVEGGVVPDPLFRLDVLYALGDAQWQDGDLETAATTLAEAAAAIDEALAPERLGARYWDLAQRFRGAGDGRRARLYTARGRAAYEVAATQRLARRIRLRLGRLCAQVGRADEALAHLEAARDQADQQQDPHMLAEAQSALAAFYLQQRRPEEAEHAAGRAIELAATVDDPALQAEAQLVTARVLEARKDHAGAERNFTEAIGHLQAINATSQLSEAYARYSEFLERRGSSTRALEILKQAWQLRERSGGGA